MAAEIPNLVKRNGIYYFRCRIPSILTNGRAREVKISLKTGNLTSDLFEVIVKVSDYSRRVIAKSSGRQIFLFRHSISVQHRQSVGKSFGKLVLSTVAIGEVQ